MSYEILDDAITRLRPLIRGSNLEQQLTIYKSQQNNQLLDELTGAAIQFEVKKSFDSGLIFEKKNQIAGGSDDQISILDSSNLSIFYEPEDTQNLPVFLYSCILTITTTAGKIYKHYFKLPII